MANTNIKCPNCLTHTINLCSDGELQCSLCLKCYEVPIRVKDNGGIVGDLVSVGISAGVGAITGSAIAGGLLGGSYLGGIVGDVLKDDNGFVLEDLL